MGKFYDSIPPDVVDWITKQHIFWVATAPLSADGHVNVSPKGVQGTFHIIDANKCWYEDLSGSGCETISHLRENGRITIMFNAFEGPAKIVRLFGTGTVCEFGTPEYETYIPLDKRHVGSRSAIVIDIHKVGTSCGWGVPIYQYKRERTTMYGFFRQFEKGDQEWALSHDASEIPSKDARTLKNFWRLFNVSSIDGLPGLNTAHACDTIPRTTRLPSSSDEEHSTLSNNEQVAIENAPSRTILVMARRESRLIIGILIGFLLELVYTRLMKQAHSLLPFPSQADL